MAQFTYNPPDLALGAATGFTTVAGSAAFTLTIVERLGVRVLRIYGGAAPGLAESPAGRVVRWDAPGTPANTQFFAKMRWRGRGNEGGNYAVAPVVRGTSSNADTDRDFYQVASNQVGSTFRKIVNNSSSDLAATDGAFLPAIDQTFCILLDAQGTTIREKHWVGDESSVPGAWNRSTTDGDHAAGAVGFFFNYATADVEVLFMGVGTDGDPAPLTAGAPAADTVAGTLYDVDGTTPVTSGVVHLIDTTTQAIVGTVTTVAGGAYSFTGLTADRRYTLVGRNSAGTLVKANIVTPEVA